MRLRNVSYAKDVIEANPNYIKDIGRTETVDLMAWIQPKKPFHIEIGTGKGQFIHTLARQEKDTVYLGIEMFDSVIIRALEKQLEDPQDNLFLLRMDAQQLKDALPAASVDVIYLNFSDPWPKARHEKRRLTSSRFLALYTSLLKPGGSIVLKTDNRHFFEYTLTSLNQHGFLFETITLDLHRDNPDDNIMTEFEEKFKDEGPIYKIIAKPKEENR